MIKKINEISNVWRFVSQVSESDFIFLNSDKLLSLFKEGSKKELLKGKVEVAEEWRNGIIINESQFYSEGKLEPIFKENTFKTLIVNDNKLLVKHIDYGKEEISYGIFNFSLGDIEWLTDFGSSQPRILINQRNLISTSDNAVKSYNLNKGDLWEKSLTELTESNKANLHSQIISSEGKLFFIVNGNEWKGLFVLDVDTGEVIKEFEDLSYEIFQDRDYIYTTQFENVLCRINAKTLELEQWNCSELIKENGFKMLHDHRCEASNNVFYFTQTIGDKKAKLGVLDWNKKELVYKHEFEPKNGAIGSIQVTESRMFVHTQDNTLHIFEKTD